MITITKKINSISPLIASQNPQENWLFFDIETTGFSSKTCHLYLIGCAYYKSGDWYLQQWLANNTSEEKELLEAFFEFARPFTRIYHYNGNGFDIPFILAKCSSYQLPYDFSSFENYDIYKEIQPLKNLLLLENLKQKTVEKFLELDREDTMNGGELISVFHEYAKTGAKDLEHLLLIHNDEDVCGMLSLLSMFSYLSLFDGNISELTCELHTYTDNNHAQKQEVIFSFSLNETLPRRISCSYQHFYMTAFKNQGKIKAAIKHQELKYFFPNYKDYYYLPKEDTSIHKSVAFYVDKDFRTNATAANCYTKKTGLFLPQEAEIVTPFFKENYKDKRTYFEFNEDFLQDTELQKRYVCHMLELLKN